MDRKRSSRSGWLSSIVSWRDYIPRKAFLLIQGPLLGISDRPSVPLVLTIPPANPSRSISHYAQEEKACLFRRPGHTWICERQGYGDSIYPTSMCYRQSTEKRMLPGHPPLVQNHFSGTQIHSRKISEKIWESGIFTL
jgi:hypothetical protein